jgi:hypothetical protein
MGCLFLSLETPDIPRGRKLKHSVQASVINGAVARDAHNQNISDASVPTRLTPIVDRRAISHQVLSVNRNDWLPLIANIPLVFQMMHNIVNKFAIGFRVVALFDNNILCVNPSLGPRFIRPHQTIFHVNVFVLMQHFQRPVHEALARKPIINRNKTRSPRSFSPKRLEHGESQPTANRKNQDRPAGEVDSDRKNRAAPWLSVSIR